MVPAPLMERSAACGLVIFRSYGLSEHPTVSCGTASDPLTIRANTDGWVSPGTEVRIVDDDGADLPSGRSGEIWCRGPEAFAGYRQSRFDADAVAPGGWLKTGDIGVLTPDGLLTITDRKKDIIIRGGENIASREVEDHLLRHPAVADAAVVGVPDERLGERVGAFIVPRPGSGPTVADLGAFLSEIGVARQKAPEIVWLRESLPRNAAGKVMKHVLRDEACQGHQ